MARSGCRPGTGGLLRGAGPRPTVVAMDHNALTRAIRHAEARDLVGRNVVLLVETPKGQAGRPGNSLSLVQSSALLGGRRLMSGGSSGRSAEPPRSASTGRHGSYAIHSCR